MSLYPTRRTPVPRDEPPHMPAVPRPRTRSTGPVGTTPGPPRPQSRRGGASPTTPSLVNVSPVHHSLGLHPMEGPPTEATPFNVPRHVLPLSPLALIGSIPRSLDSPLHLIDTLRVAHEGASPGYPTASPSRGAPSTFMELLSR